VVQAEALPEEEDVPIAQSPERVEIEAPASAVEAAEESPSEGEDHPAKKVRRLWWRKRAQRSR
jgi:hypothetical protein